MTNTTAGVGSVARNLKRVAPDRAALGAQMWPRVSHAALATFDPRTLLCTMNCGPHRDDPRTDAERKLMCGDCINLTSGRVAEVKGK